MDGHTHYVGDECPGGHVESRRAEADGPLTGHLRAIADDERIHSAADVYAILQAAALIDELRAGIRRKAAWWDKNRPDAPAYEVADDFRRLLGDDDD